MTTIRKVACNGFFARRYLRALRLLEAKNVRIEAGGTWQEYQTGELVFAYSPIHIESLETGEVVTAVMDGKRIKVGPASEDTNGQTAYLVILGEVP